MISTLLRTMVENTKSLFSFHNYTNYLYRRADNVSGTMKTQGTLVSALNPGLQAVTVGAVWFDSAHCAR